MASKSVTQGTSFPHTAPHEISETPLYQATLEATLALCRAFCAPARAVAPIWDALLTIDTTDIRLTLLSMDYRYGHGGLTCLPDPRGLLVPGDTLDPGICCQRVLDACARYVHECDEVALQLAQSFRLRAREAFWLRGALDATGYLWPDAPPPSGESTTKGLHTHVREDVALILRPRPIVLSRPTTGDPIARIPDGQVLPRDFVARWNRFRDSGDAEEHIEGRTIAEQYHRWRQLWGVPRRVIANAYHVTPNAVSKGIAAYRRRWQRDDAPMLRQNIEAYTACR